jgi:GntR family transcriptional regulator
MVQFQIQPDSAAKTKPTSLMQHPTSAYQLVQQSLDKLLSLGYSLSQAREVFLAEIDWRLRAGTQVLVTVPRHDLGAGKLMEQELQQFLQIPVQLVPLEELNLVLDQGRSGTVVTSRYFISQAEAIATPKSVRVIPIDIYDYSRELQIVRNLPKQSSLGLVSLSTGTLGVAEILVSSLRGEDLLLMTAQLQDTYKLRALVRAAHTIISDQASFSTVKAAVLDARPELIRVPQIICCESYIDTQSLALLRRELGLD